MGEEFFDEEWYLRRYPDVAEAVARGKIPSGLAHYQLHGAAERRSASPPRKPQRVFAFGAYGTNNVGDEAIFEGIKIVHPGCHQIYINKPRLPNSTWINDVLDSASFFQEGDYLILGGGGLLYHRNAIDHMLNLTNLARAAGAKVELLGIGAEAAQSSYFDGIIELVDRVEHVSVRSVSSAKILQEITGRLFPVQEDFAFRLAGKIDPWIGNDDPFPRIGLVTSGDILEDRSELAELIQLNTLDNRDKVRFFHIPHSRAYVDMRNNDVVVGHSIWSSINIYYSNREHFYKTEEFTADPYVVLNKYSKLDGVMSARFHGLIFSNMYNLPTLVMSGATPKNKSFTEDHKKSQLFTSSSNRDLKSIFGSFIEVVRNGKAKRRTS